MAASVPFAFRRARHRARACRGYSLVELLVGVALGLAVVAGLATAFALAMREQHALQLEVRLTQDLGSAADMIARDLRRAGYWSDAAAGVWQPQKAVRTNPYAAVAPLGAASDAVAFSYDARVAGTRAAAEEDERFGWRLRVGAVELLLGGRWQAVTDASLLSVTRFSVMPTVEEVNLAGLCSRPCDSAATAAGTCPPRLQVRSLTVRIAGHASADARVARSVETRVRLRNDGVVGACPV